MEVFKIYDFEDGTVTDWGGLNASVVNSGAQARTGLRSMLMTSNVSAGNPAAALTLNTGKGYPTSPGEFWYLSSWVRAGNTNRNLQLKLVWTNAVGTFLSQLVANMTSDTTLWKMFKVSGEAPANAAFVNFNVTHVSTVAAGDTTYIDDVVAMLCVDQEGLGYGSGWYGGSAYAGFGVCEDELGEFDPSPGSNVRDLCIVRCS